MRCKTVAIVAVSVSLCATRLAVSQDGEYELIIKAPKQGTAVVLDGVISPSEYSALPFHVSFIDDENPGRFHPNPVLQQDYDNTDADMSYDLYAVHTETVLYLGFRVYDEFLDIQDEDFDTPWENDAIELFMDPDNDPTDMIPDTGRESTPEGFQIVADAVGHLLRDDIIEFTAGTSLLEDGYVIEFGIPLEWLDTLSGPGERAARTGDILGFEAGLSDNDVLISDNQTKYGWIWRLDDETDSPYGCGEPCWHVGLELSSPVVEGDYSLNGILDSEDLDLQAVAIAGQLHPPEYDLTGDGLVDYDDRLEWVEVLKNTWIGDSDLNGEFNSSDMVSVFVAGKYETGQPATWEQGDWNADLVFNSSDMVVAFVAGGYEQGKRPEAAVSAVPEPSSFVLVLLGLLGLLPIQRRG
jgi:hypothetical protein